MSFFADSFRGDPHGTDPKFVRITEVFSLQFFGGTGGTGGTRGYCRHIMLIMVVLIGETGGTTMKTKLARGDEPWIARPKA